ncbi:MAG: ABC transporter substrate-binding protein [Bifidobacterium crudilactis]|nr:ABC transporter substrate-binding protein [Bifidobacterium crudilactis]
MKSLRKLMTVSVAAILSVSTLAACGSGSDSTASAGASASSDTKSASATSLSDFGGMDGLVKAANAEGALNVIALPHDWSNYGEVISAFKKKYPKIKVTEANPNASSKEEIDAIKTNAGTDAAPDVVDVGLAVAATSTKYFAPYKVQAWDSIPDNLKDSTGLYHAGYTGIMSVGWNKDKYGSVSSIDDLLDSKFAGTVALNGKPAEAGAAFNGFLMANALSGGSLTNLQPGLDFFKKLKDAGNLTQVDVTDGTIDSGQTGVVFDWTYNQASYKKSLKSKGVDWEYKTFPKAQVVSYYNQAINKDAPHPAAARLWQEFLYSAEAQNLWAEGGALPVLANTFQGEFTEEAKASVPKVDDIQTPTTEQADAITAFLQENWDTTIS